MDRLPVAEKPLQPHKNEIYNDNGDFWDDGWYVFTRGKVSGPFKASSIFDQQLHKIDSKKIIASREGFAQWYELNWLHQLYLKNSNDRLAKQSIRELKYSEAKKKDIHLFPVVKKSIYNKNYKKNPKEYLYNHLTLKGRLRLGAILNPWQMGIFNWIFTLGFFWITWFNRTCTSVIQHLDNPQAENILKPRWYCCFPGFHMIITYRLARLILQMEVEDKYKRTSPSLAFFLSLIPGLAIIYLQKSLNHHWICHVSKKYRQNRVILVTTSYLPTQN